MKNFIYTLLLILPISLDAQTEIKTETKPTGSPLVNFDDYLELALKVKEYRKDRLVTLEDFKKMSSESNNLSSIINSYQIAYKCSDLRRKHDGLASQFECF